MAAAGKSQVPPLPGMAEGVLFAVSALLGRIVRVSTADGSEYEGVLHTVATTPAEDGSGALDPAGMAPVLRMATLVRDGKTGKPPTARAKPRERLAIKPEQFCSLTARDVSMLEDAFGAANASFGRGANGARDDLATDGGISGGSRGAGRALQKWEPDSAPNVGGLETVAQHGKHWDQFEANERLYGVKGGFDESLYTTSLDKKNTKISEAEAARIAAEIEKGGGGKVHRDIDDLGEEEADEEDKFSSVLADGRGAKQNFDARNDETFGAYVMGFQFFYVS